MVSCEEAARAASRTMEQTLSLTQRMTLRMHLLMCRKCSSFARQIGYLRRLARRLPEHLDQDGA